jgi:hypothetical protein
MSKFLINLHLQIFKVLVYSKIKLLFRKEFSLTFGPIGQRPADPSGPSAQSRPICFSFQPVVPPLPLSPLDLGLSAGPARPLGPADCTSVAPCLIAAFLKGKRLSSRRLRPSPCLANRWAPPVITFLWRRPSSTPRRRIIEPPRLSRPPPCPPLFMADRYHSLISVIITTIASNSSPPFNFRRRLLPSSLPRRTSSGPKNWPPRPRRSPHLPHLTLPPLLKHDCRCC